MKHILDTVYYFRHLNIIGGVESHLYYLAKKYRDRNWVVVARSADPNQVIRLSKLVPVILLKPEDTVECKRLFFPYDIDALDCIKADEVIFVSHANYVSQVENGTMAKDAISRITNNPKIDRVISVSKTANTAFGGDVVYMPVDLDEYEPPILLVSATRLTAEKGLGRMRILAKMLDDAKVNYLWHVYTNSEESIDSPNVQFMKPRLDIVSKLPLYDALVQLSDSEAYCISMQEALMSGVPLISTDLPLLRDDFHIDEKSVITFPFDMSESGQIERIRRIKQMKAEMPTYKAPKEKWGEYLTGKMNKEIKERYQMKIYKVMANSVSYDRGIHLLELGRPARPSEIFEITEDRVDNLIKGNNIYKKPFAVIIEEVPEKVGEMDVGRIDKRKLQTPDPIPEKPIKQRKPRKKK